MAGSLTHEARVNWASSLLAVAYCVTPGCEYQEFFVVADHESKIACWATAVAAKAHHVYHPPQPEEESHMKITLNDGSILELTDPEEIRLYLVLTGQVAEPKTQADLLREAIEAASEVTPQQIESWVPQVAEPPYEHATATLLAPARVEEEAEAVINAPLPIDMPSHTDHVVIWVTPHQNRVIEVLRKHPEGLSTKEIAKALSGWPHSRASAVTTKMSNRGNIVAKVPARKRYRLTELGHQAAYKFTDRPGNKRPHCAT